MSTKPSSKQSRTDLILNCILLAISVIYFGLLIIGKFAFPAGNRFYESLNPFSGLGDPIKAVRIISLACFILSISWVVRFGLKQLERLLHKGRAMLNLFCSFIKYIAILILLFWVLNTCGVDTTTLLAGVGILGLIVGLGAQPLIADIIAGLFIVFEGIFEVGDIIVIDGFRGTVKEIGVRTTQIEDVGGNIKVVNNSDIKTLVNMTSDLSLAVSEVSIEYGESLERVEAVLAANLGVIQKEIPDIVEGPFYKGVSELGDSGVTLKFVAKCHEGNKYQVERDLNRQIKLLFDANNINIPFNQVVVNTPPTFQKYDAGKKAAAKRFVDIQRDASRHITDEGEG